MNQFGYDAALHARLRVFFSVTGYLVLNGLSVALSDTLFDTPIPGQLFGYSIGLPILFLEIQRYRQSKNSKSR